MTRARPNLFTYSISRTARYLRDMSTMFRLVDVDEPCRLKFKLLSHMDRAWSGDKNPVQSRRDLHCRNLIIFSLQDLWPVCDRPQIANHAPTISRRFGVIAI